MTAEDRTWSRYDKYCLAGVILLALVVRLLVALNRSGVGYDEANFLMIARNSAAGFGYVQSTVAEYASKFHCLSFLLLRFLGAMMGDYLLASKMLFVVLGPATVGLAVGLGSSLFGARVGLTAGALCAVAPVLTSLLAPSLTHTLFLPAYIGGLWLAWVAVEKGRPLLAVAAGVAIGLGWWARPDGLLAVPTVALFLAAGGLLLAGFRKTLLSTTGFLAGFGALYALYAVFVASISGGASEPHGPLFDFLLYVPECNPSRDLATYDSLLQLALHEPRCVLKAVVKNAQEAPSVLLTWTGFPLVLLPLLGAAWTAERRYDRRTVTAHLLVFLGIAPIAFFLPFYYKETRYIAPYAILAFFWCALGIEAVRVRISGVLGKRAGWAPLLLVVGFLLAITVLHVPRMRSTGGPEYEVVGRWVSRNTEAGAFLWTSQSQVAFYAERPWLYPPKPGSTEEWERFAGEEVFLVVDGRHFFEKNAGWAELVEAGERSGELSRVFMEGQGRHKATVYRVEPSLLATFGPE